MESTNLSNLKFEYSYDTQKDDVASDFYEKALKYAKYYDRISAFFDSKILSYYSDGIENLYYNQGKIRFIFSEELTESDYNLMKDGYEARAVNQLSEKFDNEPLDEIDKTNLSNLAFLIENGLVDIKIAFVNPGILHEKLGIIYDEFGNNIYFRGSNNETVAALEANHELFEVSCSWDNQEIENKKIFHAKEYFEKLWNNQVDNIIVVPIPEIIFKKIAVYNQGKLILKNEINYDDAIIADITDTNSFFVHNNLADNVDIDKTFDYKNFIRYSLKEYKESYYYFGDISYIKIKELLKHWENLSSSINKKFIETPKLRKYLEDKNYQIEKIKELGKLIKKQDSFVIDKYNIFADIVNEELERPLREKQMWDAFFITEMIKSANYSVPGAGKTSIVYGAYSYLTSKEKNKIDNMVVVGPISSFKSWIDEYYECFGEKRNLRVLNILDKKFRNKEEKITELKLNAKSYNLILINYEGLNSLKEVLLEVIDNRTMLVFDEIHKIKAVDGVWSSAAYYICKNAKYKVALTGTPIPNSYVDLYTQLNILFTDEYNTFFHMTPAELGSKNPVVADKINNLIYPFFCRTTKNDLSVPIPNQDSKIISYMNEKESKLFELLHRKFNQNPLLLYIRLLQASTNPKLLLNKIDYDVLRNIYEDEEENETLINLDNELDDITDNYDNTGEFDESEKQFIKSFDMTSKFWDGIDKIKSLVSDGKTVLVWGIFVNTIDRISEELNKLGISNKIIYGSVPVEEREKTIEEFKNKEIQVLITNPHTMAESVSLHKQCHDAVYFEYSFNLTHMLQSRDRINRLGLNENQYTQYYYLFLMSKDGEDDSIDFKTYNRLKEKEQVMLDAIEGERIVSINFDVLDDLKCIMNNN